MNINTTKTVLSVSNYVEDNLRCKKSAWSYKFKNSWNECDTWCDYINYFFFSNILSQVYIIDSEIIPKNKKLGFPLPVKTYDTELFSKVIFNKVERNTEGVKGYFVGTDFTVNQDIKPAYLSFYLNSDIKIPHEYVLNRYRAILLTPTTNLSVFITTNVLRYCNNDVWDNWDTWDDFENWECQQQATSTSINGSIPLNIYLTFDTKRYLNMLSNIPPTSTASIIECCNCWGDFNTWEDRSTWQCN
ncbi:MAG: hypothetical protein JHC31_00315 [Sulfurihydrogenibium sp.]|nr:hypothetical protein [Sulfurihydrogenibium sp.]